MIVKVIRTTSADFKSYDEENPTSTQRIKNIMSNNNEILSAVVDSMLWQPGTNYQVGQDVRSPGMNPGTYAQCISPGTSADTEPEWGAIGSNIDDGNAAWEIKEVGPKISGHIVSTTAPEDKSALWIDSTPGKNTLNYWNGTAWIPITGVYA